MKQITPTLFCVASLAYNYVDLSSRVQKELTRDGLNSQVTCNGLVGSSLTRTLSVVSLTSLLIMTASISKGTLNLRFMQNVQHEEQELDINTAEPVIKDESHWEVSKEVKEMWGITSEPSSSSSRYAALPCLKFTIAVPFDTRPVHS